MKLDICHACECGSLDIGSEVIILDVALEESTSMFPPARSCEL